MSDKTAFDTDEEMASVSVFSRERRVWHGVLLALLPTLIAALWIVGAWLPPESLRTMGSEYFMGACYITLFLAFAFPYVLPELSVVARQSYSLVCTLCTLFLLNYCTQRRPPLPRQIDELNQYLFPGVIVLIWGVLWLLIAYYRYRLERPLPGNTSPTVLVLIVSAWMGFMVVDPIFRQARFRSADMSCLSNLKQLELGVLIYSQDWDEKLPPATRWATLANKYIKNSRAFHCPNATSPYSYASNRALSGISIPDDVAEAANTIHLFECDAVIMDTNGGPERLAPSDRHHSGLNFGLLDGHVKWMSHDTAGKYNWRPTSATPSPGPSHGGQ